MRSRAQSSRVGPDQRELLTKEFGRAHVGLAMLLSFFMVFVLFAWQGNKGFSLWDEGFLWYGAQQTLLGNVPILDFMAYDPGRYYWSAAFMKLMDDNGIMALRVSVAVFQAMGLFAGLLLVFNFKNSSYRSQLSYLIAAVVILSVWMFPRHKLFDISLSVFMMSALAFLVRNPSTKRYFISGVCLGFIAFWGRNHGVYGFAGSICTIVWLSIGPGNKEPGLIKGGGAWITGTILGYSPILFMAVMIPDFFTAFMDSIRFLFEIKTTNLSLPIPWPWRVEWGARPFVQTVRQVLIGVFFMSTVGFGVISIAWAFWKRVRREPVPSSIVAATFLALPYAHHAYSRADVSHLSQGIFPFLVGSLFFLTRCSAKIRWPVVLLLAVTSLWVMHPVHPGWQSGMGQNWKDVEISRDNLKVSPRTAEEIRLIRDLTDAYAPGDQTIMVAPFWPGAYALLEKTSPMWEIYAFFPRSNAFEQNEIKRIAASQPSVVLILDYPLDGRDDLFFKNTHPLIFKYIQQHYEIIPKRSSSIYQVYKVRVNSDQG